MTATIALQLYSVRDALSDDVDQTLGRVAAIGFTAVELYGLARFGAQYETALAAHGLTAPSVHAALVDADQSAALDAAERLGVTTVIEPKTDPARWTDAAEIDRIAESLNAAAELADRRGMRVGYHNHDGELLGRVPDRSGADASAGAVARADTVTGLDHLVYRLDPRVVLEVDVYWAAVAGQDVAALLSRHASRVAFVHVKDGPLDGDVIGQRPAGEGDVPLAAALDAVPELEFAVVEFDAYAGDVFEGIAVGRRFLTARGLA
ncbi:MULTISPECIES: sugar phosphate isomerase/epimerase family protein [unclassified Plantibacter]|uniref:sugar phosphate isomerase/epimerase family protein n=1 Tax=unclassified Plantibacter TaxID=2624265 RepID=UPI003D336D9D